MAVAASQRQRANLPVEVSTFVGRRRELAEVRKLLSSYRLVTLTGVGGVRKTRLALRAASDLQQGFRDGVWLVDLAGLTDPALVANGIATALGLSDLSRKPVARLTDHLADRQLLLVLDNCEHLLDACAVLVDALLRSCPELRVLATSRQMLGIHGECTMRVPSLSVPDPERLPPPDALMQYEAVTLFAERAAAVLQGFTVTRENHAALAHLCQRLDGIPLALELAAVRVSTLSVAEVLERLEDRFPLLTGGSRAALPRQQTLQALMDWSFDLLSSQGRRLWARLSVFAGSFELDAAEGCAATAAWRPGRSSSWSRSLWTSRS